MKKTLSILLALTLALGLLSGCAAGSAAKTEPAASPAESTPEPAADPSAEAEPTAEPFDAEAAYAAFSEGVQRARAAIDPDTVIATVDGQALTWEMFYYFVVGDLQEVFYYTGKLPENFNEMLSEETTWQKNFTESALAQATYYLEAAAKADELGVELTDEQRAALDAAWDKVVADYGDESLLQADLDDACLDKELFLRLLESNEKLSAIDRELYGEGGEKLTDEAVLAWAAENGYVRTKHVLWSFLDETGAALSDEDKAALREKLEAKLAELRKLKNKDKLEARFDELMSSESADSDALQRDFGFTPKIGIREGLRRFAEWYRSYYQ